MLFNSVDYFLFFVIVIIIHYILPKKVRYIWLLVTSYFFYGCWNIKYTALIFFITVLTYFAAIMIDNQKIKQNTSSPIIKRALVITIVCCFALLVYFKYANFLILNIFHIVKLIPKYAQTEPRLLDIILPVGISFFTFQAVGYVIDVFRGKVEAERNIARYALFVSFFPQLVAGPIERSTNLLHQLREPKPATEERVREGIFLILIGLWQKVLIADRLAEYVNSVFSDYANYTGIEMFIAVALFGFQIYCDFGGYSNIAIGSAKLLGIDLMKNFDSPYLSKTIIDFWRRWHISLTSWFTDYLYIPLGGNRKGSVRKYINVIIVFLTSGLWHGASWNFVFWGALNGVMNVFSSIRAKRKVDFASNKVEKLFSIITTFLLVDFGWLFFRAQSLGEAFHMIKKGIGYIGVGPFLRGASIDKLFGSGINLLITIVSITLLLLFDVIQERTKNLFGYISGLKPAYRWGIYLSLVLMIVLFGAYGEGYEQNNFIYFQF